MDSEFYYIFAGVAVIFTIAHFLIEEPAYETKKQEERKIYMTRYRERQLSSKDT